MPAKAKGMLPIVGREPLRISRLCDQRCLFCFDRPAQDGRFVPLAALRRELERRRGYGLKEVVLSGGEPTLHPDYLRTVGLARELGFAHVGTVTNGRRFRDMGFLGSAVAAGLSSVNVSLHGHTPALQDRLTRTPGSFAQALAGLRNALSMPRLHVTVNVVISRLNLPALRDMIEFYFGIGAREFRLLALEPHGDAWENRGELLCDFSGPEPRAHLRRALELGRRPELRLQTYLWRPETLEDFESLIPEPEELLGEVHIRRAMFAGRRNRGAALGCAGPGCPQCSLSGLCRDFAAVREAGRLGARAGPLCLGRGPAGETFHLGRRSDIMGFARWYLRARYFAKGSSCRGCVLGEDCDGMPVGEARKIGFGAAAPPAQRNA